MPTNPYAKDPYLSDTEINQQYKNRENAYIATQRKQADQQIKGVNDKADESQKANYVNYRMGLKSMPEQMARLGLSGGATETSLLRANSNFENNTNAINKQRASDIANINKAVTNAIDAYKLNNDALKAQALETARQNRANWRINRANWEQAQQEQQENRFAKTISGWNSIEGINKEIAKIQRSKVAPWRIPYLRARRAELMAEKASRGGGGGGRRYRSSSRSSSGRRSSGGGSGSSAKSAYANALKGAFSGLLGKGGGSSSKGNKSNKGRAYMVRSGTVYRTR